jgi:ribosomal protein L19E
LRRVRGIHAYKSAEKGGEWLTMSEAATKLGVSNHQIRRLIKEGVLPEKQVVFDAPWQIRALDLQEERDKAALARKGRPCRAISENQTSIFSDT